MMEVQFMGKGKYGIDLRFFAVLGFVFAFTGWTIPLVLLVGYAVLLEKDEWLGVQTLEALMLGLTLDVCGEILSISRGIITFGVYASATYFIYALLQLVVAIFMLVGILNVAKRRDAGLPIFEKWAKGAYGIIVKHVQVQQPVYQQPPVSNMQQPVQPQGYQQQTYQQPTYQQPMQQQAYQQPVQQQTPVAPIPDVPQIPDAPQIPDVPKNLDAQQPEDTTTNQ